LPQQYDAHAQPPAGGGWASADGAAPGVVPTAVAPMAIATPSEAVQPQEASGGCSCGGAHPPQGMSPSQEEALAAQRPNVGRTQRVGAAAYHSGIPMQAAYGTQPALSPGQRTAMLAGSAGSGHQQMVMPAGRGVLPAQQSISCPCPMPNDFIWSENSQLVY